MYLCLPWELRNRINIFWAQGVHDNEVIFRHVPEGKPSFLVRQYTGPRSYEWIEDPILSQICLGRVGLETSRELMEAYYGTRTFVFSHKELDSLWTFLETDKFGLRMRPAKYVRYLRLQIQPLLYGQLRTSRSRIEEESRCCHALEALEMVQASRSTINVHVDLTQGSPESESDEDALAGAAQFLLRIVEIVNRRRTSARDIRMVFEGSWDSRDGLQVCSRSMSSLDDCTLQMKTARS
jgi:hypothetical protein